MVTNKQTDLGHPGDALFPEQDLISQAKQPSLEVFVARPLEHLGLGWVRVDDAGHLL